VRYYRENWLFLDDQGNRLAQVRSGGNPHPFLECKGKLSGDIAAAIRGKLHHRPSRVDVAIDRSGQQLFVELDQLAKAFEKKYGLRRDYAGADVENRDRGTTIYLGSRLSQVFVRIYQKGLQLAEAMGLTGDDIPDELRNWVRIELEFKPQKTKAKQVAAVAEPSAFWGLSQWTSDFAMQALSLVSERVNVSERRESDHQRALRFMAQQYRAHLQQLLHDCKGDYEAAMETLLDLADLLPAKAA
jgi:DNA relaxase NicK